MIVPGLELTRTSPGFSSKYAPGHHHLCAFPVIELGSILLPQALYRLFTDSGDGVRTDFELQLILNAATIQYYTFEFSPLGRSSRNHQRSTKSSHNIAAVIQPSTEVQFPSLVSQLT